MTLGGPIVREQALVLRRRTGASSATRRSTTRRLPVQRRGNLWFMKVTAQLQQQPTAAGQPAVRPDDSGQRRLSRHGRAEPHSRTRRRARRRLGSSSATTQITDPSAFGTLVKGGPLASFNYNWVDELVAGVPVRRQLHVQQAERSAAERRHRRSSRRRSFRATRPATSSAA